MLLIELAQKSLGEPWNNMQEPVLAQDAYKGGCTLSSWPDQYNPINWLSPKLLGTC